MASMRQEFPTALCSLAQNILPHLFYLSSVPKRHKDKVGTCPGEVINYPTKALSRNLPSMWKKQGI